QELLDVLIAHPLPEYLVMDVGGGAHGVLRAVDVNAAMAGRRGGRDTVSVGPPRATARRPACAGNGRGWRSRGCGRLSERAHRPRPPPVGHNAPPGSGLRPCVTEGWKRCAATREPARPVPEDGRRSVDARPEGLHDTPRRGRSPPDGPTCPPRFARRGRLRRPPSMTFPSSRIRTVPDGRGSGRRRAR